MSTIPPRFPPPRVEINRPLKHLLFLENHATKKLDYLVRRFGIECDVFFPLAGDTVYQEYDDSIPVSSVPDYTGLLLLPQLYQKGAPGTNTLMDFSDIEPTVYLKADQPFPRNSIIRPIVSEDLAVNRAGLYRIDKFVTMSPRAWYRKGLLVPAAHKSEVPLQGVEEVELLTEANTVIPENPGQTFNPQVNKGWRKVLPG